MSKYQLGDLVEITYHDTNKGELGIIDRITGLTNYTLKLNNPKGWGKDYKTWKGGTPN